MVYAIVAKVEDAADPRRPRMKLYFCTANPRLQRRCGIPPVADLRPQLSQRVKNMTNMVLFVDATTSGYQKLKPIFPKPLLLFFLNLSRHIFYATMGFVRAG